MESIKLDKGEVLLMEDRLIIENDGVVNRKRRNIILYSLIFILILFYLVSSYQSYVNDPHQFQWFRFMTRIFLLVMLIIPTAINKVFRYSTVNEIPYSHIKKHGTTGWIFKWNGAINLYLQDNNIRTLSFEGDDMKKFRSLLDHNLGKKA